ncbi:hypothetical protein M513_00471 [Trichuris suis]|uniref:Uncharacterized protein n=1 Tax=Trichuris suis TaxID=68888 RepID=A0A085MNI2_9BILA|nr:hypothetical protein M513_00471 [Trichuris suis]
MRPLVLAGESENTVRSLLGTLMVEEISACLCLIRKQPLYALVSLSARFMQMWIVV